MGELIFGLVLVVGLPTVIGLGFLLSFWISDTWLPARRKKAEDAAQFQGTWQVAERTTGKYLIIGCRRTLDGRETGWVDVASIPHDDPGWQDRVLTARVEADLRREQLGATQ